MQISLSLLKILQIDSESCFEDSYLMQISSPYFSRISSYSFAAVHRNHLHNKKIGVSEFFVGEIFVFRVHENPRAKHSRAIAMKVSIESSE